MGMKTLKGSYTIEAAILVPFFLFIMAGTIQSGIQLYTQIREQDEASVIKDVWAVSDFYKCSTVGEWLEDE